MTTPAEELLRTALAEGSDNLDLPFDTAKRAWKRGRSHRRNKIVAVGGGLCVLVAVGIGLGATEVSRSSAGKGAGSIAGSGVNTLTGYRTLPPTSFPQGAVPPPPQTVAERLSATQATTIENLVNGLRPIPAEPDCHGFGVRLLYRVSLGSTAQNPTRQVSGYICGGTVSITSGGTTRWYRDSDCALIMTIRQLAPANATATRTDDVGCEGPSGPS
jgi:hypothetical protein